MKSIKTIAFFDFDGTITKKDSFLCFLKFTAGSLKYYFGIFILSPFIFLYFLGILKDFRIKQYFLKYFLKNKSLNELKQTAVTFSRDLLPDILRPKAIERINWHKSQEHSLVLVSASAGIWLQEFCKDYDFHLISTRLEVINNKITGNILGKNCKGPVKLERIREEFNLENFQKIYAYGDSGGDKEMMDIADESFYKPFKN